MRTSTVVVARVEEDTVHRVAQQVRVHNGGEVCAIPVYVYIDIGGVKDGDLHAPNAPIVAGMDRLKRVYAACMVVRVPASVLYPLSGSITGHAASSAQLHYRACCIMTPRRKAVGNSLVN